MEITGKISSFLESDLIKGSYEEVWTETEIKFLLHKDWLKYIASQENVVVKKIEQIYLPEEIVSLYIDQLRIPSNVAFKEWCIRCLNDDEFVFISKTAAGKGGTQRQGYQVEITKKLFDQLKKNAQDQDRLQYIDKTRYSLKCIFEDTEVGVDVDDYHVTGKGKKELDFITCEVEVPSIKLADAIISAKFFPKELQFLRHGYNITGIIIFFNKYLAKDGFIVDSYSGLLDWLYQYHFNNVEKNVIFL
jgi:hypothetical protein